jgi:hypothetical protein
MSSCSSQLTPVINASASQRFALLCRYYACLHDAHCSLPFALSPVNDTASQQLSKNFEIGLASLGGLLLMPMPIPSSKSASDDVSDPPDE